MTQARVALMHSPHNNATAALDTLRHLLETTQADLLVLDRQIADLLRAIDRGSWAEVLEARKAFE